MIAVATPGKPSVVIDRITYSPYGEATRTLRSDVNGDRAVNSDDYKAIQLRIGTKIGASGYIAEADLDRDGKITQADYDICIADWGQKSSGGVGEAALFSAGVRNDVGYCGYIYNLETGLYTVRFRTYSPTLGRWLTRDPAGYVDGTNLYQYVRGSSTQLSDPLGLQPAMTPFPCPECGGSSIRITDTSGLCSPAQMAIVEAAAFRLLSHLREVQSDAIRAQSNITENVKKWTAKCQLQCLDPQDAKTVQYELANAFGVINRAIEDIISKLITKGFKIECRPGSGEASVDFYQGLGIRASDIRLHPAFFLVGLNTQQEVLMNELTHYYFGTADGDDIFDGGQFLGVLWGYGLWNNSDKLASLGDLSFDEFMRQIVCSAIKKIIDLRNSERLRKNGK